MNLKTLRVGHLIRHKPTGMLMQVTVVLRTGHVEAKCIGPIGTCVEPSFVLNGNEDDYERESS